MSAPSTPMARSVFDIHLVNSARTAAQNPALQPSIPEFCVDPVCRCYESTGTRSGDGQMPVDKGLVDTPIQGINICQHHIQRFVDVNCFKVPAPSLPSKSWLQLVHAVQTAITLETVHEWMDSRAKGARTSVSFLVQTREVAVATSKDTCCHPRTILHKLGHSLAHVVHLLGSDVVTSCTRIHIENKLPTMIFEPGQRVTRTITANDRVIDGIRLKRYREQCCCGRQSTGQRKGSATTTQCRHVGKMNSVKQFTKEHVISNRKRVQNFLKTKTS